MNIKSLCRLLVVVLLTGWAGPSMGGISDSWDWKGKARKLKVFYDFKDTDKLGDKLMKDIMDEAIKNWNDVKADTGWEFETGGTEADHHVRIKVDDTLNKYSGAVSTGLPGAGNTSREVEHRTITFDPTPQHSDGTKFDWDAAGKNKDDTKNPVSTAKHELSHMLRLSHQGGNRTTTGKIKDPTGKVTKGDDVLTVSQDDKNEAKKSSTAPIKTSQAPGVPGTNAFALVPGFPLELPVPVKTPDLTLTVPGSAFTSNAILTLSRTDLSSMPLPFDVPAGVFNMLKGAHIDITGVPGIPGLTDALFTLTIPYEDGAEGEGFLIDVNDPDYGRLIESTLRPFLYDPLAQSWLSIDPAALGGSYVLDTVNDVAQLRLPSSLLFKFPDPNDPVTGTLFLSIAATPVPEPATTLLLLIGVLAAGALRTKSGRASNCPWTVDGEPSA